MKLSIIVPVYNTEKLLSRCVESLINLDENDYEIILVNDCSKDNSLNVMYELKAKYPNIIKTIDSKENLRQGGARNLGMDIAQGDYISFIDSDDYVDTNAYFKMVEKCNGQDVVYNRVYFLRNCEGITTKVEKVPFSADEFDITLIKRLMATCPGVCDCFYNKTFLNSNKLRFVEHMAYEDNLFVFQVIYNVRTISSCDVPYYYYCTNLTGTCSTKDAPHQKDRFIIGDMLYDYFNKNDIDHVFKDEIEAIITRQIIVNGRKNAISQYTKPNYENLKLIKDKYVKQFPKYKKNIYYKEIFDYKNRLAMDIADVSDHLFVFIFGRFLSK